MTQFLKQLAMPLALLILFGAALLQYEPLVELLGLKLTHPAAGTLLNLIQAGLWLAGATLFNRLLNHFLWQGLIARALGTPPPRLLVDVGALLVYFFAIAGIVAFVFKRPVTGLWATSGLVGLVLGLALRNIILDIFMGLAINVDRPYQVGDWIMIHGRRVFPEENVIGCVKDINWRTTRIRTTDNNMVMVPNSVIGSKVVTNFTVPDEKSRFELVFCLDFSVPPEKALRVLEAAVITARGLLQVPRSKARITGVSELGVEYKIRYWILPAETSPNKARHFVCSTSTTRRCRPASSIPRPTKAAASFSPRLGCSRISRPTRSTPWPAASRSVWCAAARC